jgi:hypothetical protein
MSAFLNELEQRSDSFVMYVTRIQNKVRHKKKTDQTRKDFLIDWLCVKLLVSTENFIKTIKAQQEGEKVSALD